MNCKHGIKKEWCSICREFEDARIASEEKKGEDNE
jgi:hypothetical protein